MKLYHGTTEAAVNAALNQGILPRSETKARGNWKHTADSRPDCSYLTTVYAGYFAGCATQRGRWGIIEVDTDLIPEMFMLPDEDYLEQSTGTVAGIPAVAGLKKANAIKDRKKRMLARTRWFRRHLPLFGLYWKESVAKLGNCCVLDGVPAEAITRVSFFNPKSNTFIAHTAMDPMISMMNYMIMGDRYRALTSWLMGDGADSESFGPFFDQAHEAKIADALKATDGIEVIRINEKAA